MYFRFKHLIFPVCKSCELVVEPVSPVAVDAGKTYELQLSPYSGLRRYGLRNAAYTPTEEDSAFFAQAHALTAENGVLKMTLSFPQEDCYICTLLADGEPVEKLELYALEEDLFRLNPYKGDNHMHTWYSDGKDSPMYMAAAACRLGYDYCVITDHGQYQPSVLARDFFAETGVDFVVVPGEEVHSPDNPVHLINLGGRESVNDWWRYHEDEYRAAVEEELKNIPETMLEKDRYTAAASQVMFDRIRSVDGASILCHPNWILKNGFNEHEDVTDYLFDHRRFDVLELIAGGAYEVGTQMQLSYYHDRETMPVVGNSDSHSCFGGQLEPGNYTIVFADALDADSIKNAIRAGHTVAGNANKLYGEYRLVKYGYFLLRNYYPEHSKLRFQLGAQMLRMASSMGKVVNGVEKLATPRPSEGFAPLRCE